MLLDELAELSEEDLNAFLSDNPDVFQEISNESVAVQGRWVSQDRQQMAIDSKADVILYGGAAGGGKTDLAVGLIMEYHVRTLFIRREGVQNQGAKDRIAEILGTRDGFNSQTGVWRFKDGRQVQFGGVPSLGDETKYQGNPRDLLVLDEAANLLESQARFLMGWVRTNIEGQRCRTLMCSNPPTSAEGQWLIQYFAPWLDPKHENPAEHGELRWFATVKGIDIEVEDDKPFVIIDEEKVYDFDPKDFMPQDIIKPQSRTFIPSKVSDNQYLTGTGYVSTLQALPEPLRSQMLHGDFLAGMEDDVWQVIPTAWVLAAQERWDVENGIRIPMSAMGVDVSRGGRDESNIAPRHGRYHYAKIHSFDGETIPNGATLGLNVLRVRKDSCPAHVDGIGVGTSVVDWLEAQGVHVESITGSESAKTKDASGNFSFRNLRSELWWGMREMLDPNGGLPIELPPDPQLRSDLCAPKYTIKEGNVIQVEKKEDIIKRIGRSPDRGDAVIYASYDSHISRTTILNHNIKVKKA